MDDFPDVESSNSPISVSVLVRSAAPELRVRRRVNLSRWLGVAGCAFLMIVGLAGIFAPLIAPWDPVYQDLTAMFVPPIWQPGGSVHHLLGTDALGRDTLSRLIYGARESLFISCSAVALSAVFGTIVGLVGGYAAGSRRGLAIVLDRTLLAMTEISLAIPGLVLAIAVVALFGPTERNLILVLAVFGWVVFARLARGLVLGLHNRAFVEAAQVLGAKHRRIIVKHMLPYVLPHVIVIAALQVGYMILVESALGFLGLGIQPPTPTWGNMVADGREYLNTNAWEGILAGLAITLTVLSLSFVADLIRVRLTHSGGAGPADGV
jgi:peptide/nickel transport system permease protein